MDCPKCGTWNPDDKIKCWRCGADMPKPPEPKKPRKPMSQTWVWVVAIILLVVSTLVQCGVLRLGDPSDSVGLWPTVGQWLLVL